MSRRTGVTLKTLLLGLDCEVEAPATILGRSGVSHDFTLCARMGEEKLVIDVEEDERPLEISILALRAKSLDAGINRSVLVTDAPVTETAGRLSESYNTRIIRPGTPIEDMRRQLSEIISSDPKDSPQLVS